MRLIAIRIELSCSLDFTVSCSLSNAGIHLDELGSGYAM